VSLKILAVKGDGLLPARGQQKRQNQTNPLSPVRHLTAN